MPSPRTSWTISDPPISRPPLGVKLMLGALRAAFPDLTIWQVAPDEFSVAKQVAGGRPCRGRTRSSATGTSVSSSRAHT